MRAVDIIQNKRDGRTLTSQEIHYLIEGYVKGDIPDYQLSAWAMAVYFQGLSARETADLTMAMAASGDQIDLGQINGKKVDKHSTGGVGDTTTIVLAPLVAAAGVPVAKMSGRGLGHTGGTIDKLESIPGFSVERTREQFIDQVNDIGVAVISQSGNITPADKMLYGLRDVTATVESIPLIASSIMSKKIAAGADAIVLDVKTGGGAFMKTAEDSIRLAQAMVDIGGEVGRETIAIISSMNEPLGYAIGNALEVKEAIDTLAGRGPADLTELCLTLGTYMVIAGGQATDEQSARRMLERLLRSGKALERFKQFVAAQGGDVAVIEDHSRLASAEHVLEVRADRDGYVSAMDAEAIGRAAMKLGAGRETKQSRIDMAAGIILRAKVGDRVDANTVLAELHTNRDKTDAAVIIEEVRKSIELSETEPAANPFIHAIVTESGVRLLT